jgi:hypothetical protein
MELRCSRITFSTSSMAKCLGEEPRFFVRDAARQAPMQMPTREDLLVLALE